MKDQLMSQLKKLSKIWNWFCTFQKSENSAVKNTTNWVGLTVFLMEHKGVEIEVSNFQKHVSLELGVDLEIITKFSWFPVSLMTMSPFPRPNVAKRRACRCRCPCDRSTGPLHQPPTAMAVVMSVLFDRMIYFFWHFNLNDKY